MLSSSSSNMVDQVTRGFRSRLITTFDGVLRKALIDVMDIFEGTIKDFEMLMEQKESEVRKLQVKLQTVELKLKEHVCESYRGPDTRPPMERIETSQAVEETQQVSKEPDDWCAPLGFEQTPKKEVVLCPYVRLRPLSVRLPKDKVVKCDLDLYLKTRNQRVSKRQPDDWCAPVGLETSPKKEACPSVRLKPLSIPVPNIPLLKNEVVNCDLDLYLQTRKRRVSKRLSALKEGTNPVLGTKLSLPLKEPQHPVRKEVSTVTLTIEKENPRKRNSNIQTGGLLTRSAAMREKKREKRRKSRGICKKRVRGTHCKRSFKNLKEYITHNSSCRELFGVLGNAPTSAETQTVKIEHTPCSISSVDPTAAKKHIFQ